MSVNCPVGEHSTVMFPLKSRNKIQIYWLQVKMYILISVLMFVGLCTDQGIFVKGVQAQPTEKKTLTTFLLVSI